MSLGESSQAFSCQILATGRKTKGEISGGSPQHFVEVMHSPEEEEEEEEDLYLKLQG